MSPRAYDVFGRGKKLASNTLFTNAPTSGSLLARGPATLRVAIFVLADELQERDLWRSSALMEMQPRLVVLDREVDGFL